MDNNFPVVIMKQNFDSGIADLNSTNNQTGYSGRSKVGESYDFEN